MEVLSATQAWSGAVSVASASRRGEVCGPCAESVVATNRRRRWQGRASCRMTRSTRLWLTVQPPRGSAWGARR